MPFVNILLVEDEIKLTNAIKRALELQRWRVAAVFDGESGLDLSIGGRLLGGSEPGNQPPAANQQ
jgi:CheY-like chemotaxis protein